MEILHPDENLWHIIIYIIIIPRSTLHFQIIVLTWWVKIAKILTFESIYYVKNDPGLSNFFYIREYHFRNKIFDIDNFKPLYFLKWRPIFDDFYSIDARLKNLLMGWLLILDLNEWWAHNSSPHKWYCHFWDWHNWYLTLLIKIKLILVNYGITGYGVSRPGIQN